MAEVYRYFAREYKAVYDFSDAAKQAMFKRESYGGQPTASNNGFQQGKNLLDITVSNWNEDLRSGLLHASELYLQYPKWFVEKVISKQFHLSDKNVQDFENTSGHLYPRVDFNNFDSGDKQFYFDLLNISSMHEQINGTV